MLTVDQMIEDVIKREGGYVDHPADRGGPTKYGITQKTLDGWLNSLDATIRKYWPVDVRHLKQKEAKTIYGALYYKDPGINQLPRRVQPLAFDAAVHHGPAQAVKMLQAACAQAGYDPGPLDGIVGTRTIEAAHRYDRAMLDDYLSMRADFMRAIVARDPSQAVFLAGWLNRLKEFA